MNKDWNQGSEIENLLNDNWHPLIGRGGWRLSDRMLKDQLEDAEIFGEVDCGPVTIIAGRLHQHCGLDASGRGHAFMCVEAASAGKSEDELRHSIFIPTANVEPEESYAIYANGTPMTEDD